MDEIGYLKTNGRTMATNLPGVFACGDAQTFCNELASGAVVAAFVDPGLVLPAQQSPVREAIERSEIPVVICTDLLPSTVLFLLDVVAAGASQIIVREIEDSLENIRGIVSALPLRSPAVCFLGEARSSLRLSPPPPGQRDLPRQ